MTYTDEDLLDALRSFHAEHGHPPTTIEANDPATDLPSCPAYRSHFGSWNAAIEQAGLEPRDRRRTDEELLADLRAVAEVGTYPSYNVVADREAMASPQTYDRRFGSWTEALAAAGLMPVSAEATTREDAEATNE